MTKGQFFPQAILDAARINSPPADTPDNARHWKVTSTVLRVTKFNTFYYNYI